MKTARVSKVAPFVFMALIPLSWRVQIMYNNHIVKTLTDEGLSTEQINAIKELYVNIPMETLVTALMKKARKCGRSI